MESQRSRMNDNQLYSAQGPVGTFLTGPSVKHGHVMLSGFLVVGTLARY